ncbi:beta-1,4-N-acetylglucosaminyltransferase [Nematocida ausubeli]|nr:beta-1,4-N-acetylglucosaminyltransferase [Nematocida ausubeli]
MQKETVPLVVLGGGGHTQEIIYIMKIGPCFSNMTLIHGSCDSLSKSLFLQEISPKKHTSYSMPRPNNVLEKYSVFQMICSLFSAIMIILRSKSDFLICNGPGISVPVALAYRLLHPGRPIFYIESLTRVKTLSAAGKIIQYIASVFIVQSKELSRNTYPCRRFHSIFKILPV